MIKFNTCMPENTRSYKVAKKINKQVFFVVFRIEFSFMFVCLFSLFPFLLLSAAATTIKIL